MPEHASAELAFNYAAPFLNNLFSRLATSSRWNLQLSVDRGIILSLPKTQSALNPLGIRATTTYETRSQASPRILEM